MPRPAHIPVSFAVEGDTDEAVVRKIATRLAVDVHQVLGKQGKPRVLKALPGLNNSARGQPWFVLLDLNGDAPCPGGFVRTHLPTPSRHMQLRLAVCAVEAWLLADRTGFSRFMAVRVGDIPTDPERERDPKGAVIDLARRSRRSIIRTGMPPRPGSGRRTGDLYASLLIEFASDHWDLEAARRGSRSLDRATTRLDELAAPC